MSTHTKIYGLLTTPILHTILIPKKKNKNKTKPTRLITMQSKCLQPKTSIFQLKSLLGKIKVKKRKEKKKKKKKERKKERK